MAESADSTEHTMSVRDARAHFAQGQGQPRYTMSEIVADIFGEQRDHMT